MNVAPWAHRAFALEEVRFAVPSLSVRVRPDGTINLMDLVRRTRAGPARVREACEVGLIRVDHLDVRSFTLRVTTLASPIAHIGIDSLDLALAGFSSVRGDTSTFEMRMLLERGGQVRASGWVMPLDNVFDARVDVDSLALVAAEPYLLRQSHVSIRSGRLDVHGNLHVVVPPGKPPDANFTGDFLVADLHTLDTLKEQDFFGFRNSRSLAAQPRQIRRPAKLDEAASRGIYARIAVAQDRELQRDRRLRARHRARGLHSGGVGRGSRPRRGGQPPPDIAVGRTHQEWLGGLFRT